jgi:hypothetical protein
MRTPRDNDSTLLGAPSKLATSLHSVGFNSVKFETDENV